MSNNKRSTHLKTTPLTSREPSKKGFKKIYKKILKSSGHFPPHKFKRQNRMFEYHVS